MHGAPSARSPLRRRGATPRERARRRRPRPPGRRAPAATPGSSASSRSCSSSLVTINARRRPRASEPGGPERRRASSLPFAVAARRRAGARERRRGRQRRAREHGVRGPRRRDPQHLRAGRARARSCSRSSRPTARAAAAVLEQFDRLAPALPRRARSPRSAAAATATTCAARRHDFPVGWDRDGGVATSTASSAARRSRSRASGGGGGRDHAPRADRRRDRRGGAERLRDERAELERGLGRRRRSQAEFPELRLWSLRVARRARAAAPPGLRERLRALSDRFHGAQAVQLRTDPIPHAYRVFFRHVGLDPDTERTPVEAAVVDRLLHGGFRSRGLVDDALLVAVVETGVPLWALDDDTRRRRARHPAGGRARVARARRVRADARPGRLVVADDARRSPSCSATRRPATRRGAETDGAAPLHGPGGGRPGDPRRGGALAWRPRRSTVRAERATLLARWPSWRTHRVSIPRRVGRRDGRPARRCARRSPGLERQLGDALVTAFPHTDGRRAGPAAGRGPRVLGARRARGPARRARRPSCARRARRSSERGRAAARPTASCSSGCCSSPSATSSPACTASDVDMGGCGAYQVRPRLGLIGMLLGWWHVKLSSGCPVSHLTSGTP